MKRRYPAKGELPPNRTYVLAYFPDKPWGEGRKMHKYVVVQFRRGINEKEREALPDDSERKHTYKAEDIWGNNQRPYNWDEFGPGSFFGQECEFWYYLPHPKKESK